MINPEVKTIDVHELKNRMENQPNCCLIDVRELEEWQELRIPGAQHIPKDSIVHTIESIMPNKAHPIYLHCKGGVRSLYAAQKLIELGYEDVYSVEGGIIKWAQSGYPVDVPSTSP